MNRPELINAAKHAQAHRDSPEAIKALDDKHRDMQSAINALKQATLEFDPELKRNLALKYMYNNAQALTDAALEKDSAGVSEKTKLLGALANQVRSIFCL